MGLTSDSASGVIVPETGCPLSEDDYHELTSLYSLPRVLQSADHAVDVFVEVLNYVCSHI